MGTEQNYVIYAIDILDCVKEITMRADAVVSQILLNLPGKRNTFYCIYMFPRVNNSVDKTFVVRQTASLSFYCLDTFLCVKVL